MPIRRWSSHHLLRLQSSPRLCRRHFPLSHGWPCVSMWWSLLGSFTMRHCPDFIGVDLGERRVRLLCEGRDVLLWDPSSIAPCAEERWSVGVAAPARQVASTDLLCMTRRDMYRQYPDNEGQTERLRDSTNNARDVEVGVDCWQLHVAATLLAAFIRVYTCISRHAWQSVR